MTSETASTKKNALRSDRGSALVAIIAAIVIFSVLAASLIPMISTSGRQAAVSALTDRAYLLAESGYRLVESRYRSAGPIETNQNAALEDLDGGNFTLTDDEGEFRLRVYSYFYEITGDANATATQIGANPPGSIPVDATLDQDAVQVSPGDTLLSIDGNLYTVSSSSPTPFTQEANVTFTVDPLSDAVSAGTIAYPAATVRTSVGSLSNGGALTYESGQGALFPLRNGRIILNGSIALDYLYNNRDSNQFEGLRPSNPDITTMNFPVSAGSPMVLTNYARVHSLGIVGGDTHGTEREIIYYSALPGDGGWTHKEEDKFDESDSVPDNWNVTDPGATEVDIAEVGGNRAMRITTAEEDSSLVELKSSVSQDAFNAYRRSTGGYLSYDAQVKLGFRNTNYSPPYLDNPVPVYAAAGLSFRLNSVTSNTTFNGYGLSFLKGNTSILDGVPNEIVPSGLNDQPLIVLWHQVDSGATRQWIAYKRLQRLLYAETFDSGTLNGWTRIPDSSENLWHLDTGLGYPSAPSIYFGPIEYTYQNGTIQSPDIALACSDAPRIGLTFRSWENFDATDDQELRIYDVDSGTRTTVSLTKTSIDSNFWLVSADLSEFADHTIRIEFYFDKDSSDPFDWGWFVDDIKITCQWPVHNSTLAVRLQETAKVIFDQGGTEAFEMGDRVYGQTSGAMGTVISPPLLSDSDWAGGSAVGTLLLNNVSTGSQFQAGEQITTVGHSVRSARVTTYDSTTDAQTNIIKTYYASETEYPPGNIEGNTDPLDAHTLAYPRREPGERLEWFAEEGDNWTPDQDYFRIIQWDAVNSAATGGEVANLTTIPDPFGGAIAIDNVILSHYHPDLQTPPTSSSLGLPELGLHAYGTGTTNIYYDDFGFKLVFPPTGLFPSPLQQ